MRVTVEVYKPTGKYYTSGEYELPRCEMHQVYEVLRDMALRGQIPGLTADSKWSDEPGKADWLLRFEVPDHPHNHPTCIPLFRDAQGNRTWKHPLA